jgi:hypothetical protein
VNLRNHYRKVRELQEALVEPYLILRSHATPDGGREGVLTEVPRHLAAEMIADGRARLADEADAKRFRERAEPLVEVKAAKHARAPKD